MHYFCVVALFCIISELVGLQALSDREVVHQKYNMEKVRVQKNREERKRLEGEVSPPPHTPALAMTIQAMTL